MTLLSRASRLLPIAALLFAGASGYAQAAPAAQTSSTDRSSAYYHYGLAHLYEDMAVNGGRSDYATQAVEEYKLALQADPNSPMLQDGLADLYFKIGRVPEAITAAQERIKSDPNNIDAHTLLGHVYLRSLGESQTAESAQVLQLAIGEYEKLAQLKPNDVETRLILGQLYGLNHDSAKAEAQFKAAQKIDADSEEVVLNMARLYGQDGEIQRAVDTLSSVPVDDRTERMEFALGASYDLLKKPKDAAAAYRRALELEPDNLDAKRGLANALLMDEQFDESLKLLNQIVVAEPQDAQAQIHIAEIERRQGHYEDALATLKKAQALAPDSLSLDLSYNEALTDDALGRYDDAVKVLTGILAEGAHTDGAYSEGEKGNRATFLYRLGIVYREANQTDKAVDAYKQMVALGGDYVAQGVEGEIDAYRDAHQWQEATAAAADAAKANPKDHNVQLLYASQLADTGKPDEGIALAKTQLTGAADDRDTFLSIAQMDIRLKRWDDASAQIDKAEALATKPDQKWYIVFVRGTLYDRQKRYDESEAQFRKALEIKPDDPSTLNYLGYQMADRGVKLNEALTMLQKAVELDPQNGAYLDSLGWVYFKLGKYDLAEENLRKAIARMDTDPTVHDHLGEIYEKNGKLKLAVAQWEMSLHEYANSLPPEAEPADVARVQHLLDNARVKLAKLSAAPQK